MKSRRFIPPMLVVCLAAATLLWAGDAGNDRTSAEIEKELRALRSHRIETALKGVKAYQAAYDSGTVTLDMLLAAIDNLATARLAVARTSVERIAAYRERLNATRQVEQRIEVLFKAGSRGGEAATYSMALFARQSAEIDLLEEELIAARATEGQKDS